jgi:hypothetical protein
MYISHNSLDFAPSQADWIRLPIAVPVSHTVKDIEINLAPPVPALIEFMDGIIMLLRGEPQIPMWFVPHLL